MLAELVDADSASIQIGDCLEELPVLHFPIVDGSGGFHIEGFFVWLLSIFHGADIDAECAAGAVFWRDLNCYHHPLPIRMAGRSAPESFGGLLQVGRIIDLGAQASMGTDSDTLEALDADLRIPNRNFKCEVTLFVPGRSGGEGPVRLKGTDRDFISSAYKDSPQHVSHILWSPRIQRRSEVLSAGDAIGNLDLVKIGQGLVYGVDVLLDDVFSLPAIGLADGLFDFFNRSFLGKDPCQSEEAGLHDGVDPAAHSGLTGHTGRVDDKEAGLLLNEFFLDRARQVIPDLIWPIRRVQEEGSSGNEGLCYVIPFQEDRLVAGHEVGLRDEVGRANRARSEPEVGDRHRPRLSGVIDEVTLCIVVCLFADDLDRVFVCSYGAVRAQAVEDRTDNVIWFDREVRIKFQTRMRDIVMNADGEVVFGIFAGQIVKDGLHHSRSEFLRGEAITAPIDLGYGLPRSKALLHGLLDGIRDVEVERFPFTTRFLGPVQDGNGFDSSGKSFNESFDVEGPIEANFDDTYLVAVLVEVFDRFMGCLTTGSHQHNHIFRVRNSHIIEEVVTATGQLRKPVHDLLRDIRTSQVEGIAAFTHLEEVIRVLGGPA